MVVVVALLALGGCQGGWTKCTSLYVVDEERGVNLHKFYDDHVPGNRTTLKYRFISKSPPVVEVYFLLVPKDGVREEETSVISLKPGQNVQCLNYK